MAKTTNTESAPRGHKIMTAHGVDTASGMKLNDEEAKFGKEMGGSVTNLGHSLSGASAVQTLKGGK